jgi:hypothetical protein
MLTNCLCTANTQRVSSAYTSTPLLSKLGVQAEQVLRLALALIGPKRVSRYQHGNRLTALKKVYPSGVYVFLPDLSYNEYAGGKGEYRQGLSLQQVQAGSL